MNHSVEVLFKKEYWNGTIIDKDVIWNNEKRDYVVLVTDLSIGEFLETPYYKDGQLLGYLVYSSAISIRTPKRKDGVLGYFKNLLVVDPQEDCECEIETYDSDGDKNIVWLREGEPEIVNHVHRIQLPMSLNQITKEQFQRCVLTALPFAKQITVNDISRFENIIINRNSFDKLPEESKSIIDDFYRYNHRFLLPEIPEDHVYFAPPPEELGVFTWNLSRHGMFIIADHLGFLVI